MSLKLVAQRSFPYAGQSIHAGQIFEACSDQDVKALTIGGHAISAPDDESPEPTPSEAHHAADMTPKRSYRRRAAVSEHSDAD